MRRIDARTVELSLTEVRVMDLFDDLLSDGKGITEAAQYAVNRTIANTPRWMPDAEFLAYISENTLTFGLCRVVRK
jgi:hypothetical protein